MPVIATPIEKPKLTPVTGVLAPVCDVDGFVRSVETSTEKNCSFDCTEVFVNVRVLPTIRRGTSVEWELHPNFLDPGPYEFQLQFGRTGNSDATDWEIVGLSSINAFMMIDDEQRVYGKTNWAHYRICLTTPLAQYFSKPVSSLGHLSFQDRRIVAEMLRAELTMLRVQSATGGVAGALLKRRLFGAPCICLDKMTMEVTNPNCDVCYGTGFAGGYYAPINCTFAALAPSGTHNNLDSGRGRGTVDDKIVVPARMIAIPQLFEEDVWVDPKNDDRWYIHEIKNIVEWRGIAIAVKAELRFAPYSDPIYDIDVPNLLPENLAV